MQRNSAKNPDSFFNREPHTRKNELEASIFCCKLLGNEHTLTHTHSQHTHTQHTHTTHTHTTHTHTHTLVPHTISNVVVAEMDDKGIKYGNEHS
jgi:hypothetical protein